MLMMMMRMGWPWHHILCSSRSRVLVVKSFRCTALQLHSAIAGTCKDGIVSFDGALLILYMYVQCDAMLNEKSNLPLNFP